MAAIRSLLYAILFYLVTVLCVLSGIVAAPFGRRGPLAVVLIWAELHHWLAEKVLAIRIRVEGEIPAGPYLVAIKHQAMLETMEMVRLTHLPVMVIKQELADIPLFGWMTRRYGAIPVERSAGAKAIRALVQEARQAVATRRPIIIYPEGTRVRVGETPQLKSGFAAIYRAVGLPVVPVATDSGHVWGRGFVHHSGTVTFKVGETIPPGLKREEVEARVHAAINALELGPQVSA